VTQTTLSAYSMQAALGGVEEIPGGTAGSRTTVISIPVARAV
jgi:hypothetical protein